MTTNNEVKAPRPCTLWGQTFDIYLIKELSQITNNGYPQYVVTGKNRQALALSPVMPEHEEDISAYQNKMLLEASQAIASAQRQWLKAEGFGFVEGEVYHVLDTYGSHFFAIFSRNTPIENLGRGDYKFSEGFISSDSKGVYYSCEDSYYMSVGTKKEDVLAFKPISDSQEAWDELAHVEVYKESTNDTQTNG
jgi:hypothetical protein